MKIEFRVAVVCLSAGIFFAPRQVSAQGTMSQSTEVPVHVEKNAAQILGNNFHLVEKLTSLLPGDYPPAKAAVGYYDIEEFDLAVRAAHDLGIPFPQFRCTELGGKFCDPPTSAKSMNLEKTIHTLKPSMSKNDINTAAKAAKKESHEDLKGVYRY